MQTKPDRRSYRVCLNCGNMKHSRDDYYVGKCLYDGHSVDNIRNHDWCRHWKYFIEDQYEVGGSKYGRF